MTSRRLGRLLVREGKVAGLFIPFEDNPLPQGIYNVTEILGEITINYVGAPALALQTYNGIGLEELWLARDTAGMTAKEWEEAQQKIQDALIKDVPKKKTK